MNNWIRRLISLMLCISVLLTVSVSFAYTIQPSKAKRIITLDRGASLRSTPENLGSGNKIASIHADTYLDVLGQVDLWYYVNYNGQSGFVSSGAEVTRVVEWNSDSQSTNSSQIHDNTPVFTPKVYNVLVINYDPVFEAANGKRWHKLFNWWNDPRILARQFASDMNEVSHGYLTYQIAEWIDLDEMPAGQNGFVYDENEYYQTLRLADKATNGSYWNYDGWKDYGSNYDYEGLLERFRICDRVNNGEIDEVWVFAGPMHGNTMYETRMIGKNAFWCNSPGLEKNCKRFVVYGFNYERGAAEMIHDAGHRMESVLSEAFGWTDYNKAYSDYTDWEKFSAYEAVSPGHAGVGLVHFTPNSVSDYDYDNASVVSSSCDDWLNYPNLTGIRRNVTKSDWGGDQRSFLKWWFSHIPHVSGTNPQNGKYNNWWIYFTLE